MPPCVLTELNEGILTLTLNRPDKLNALNSQLIEELGNAINNFKTDPASKACIITGAGPKAFAAGADIAEFTSLDATGGTHLAERGASLVFNAIENSPKPIVAAVNGFALGGGCELAMACHFRLASQNAKFGQPEVNLGLIPGYGGTQRLVHLIGKGKATELLLTGQMIGANDALALGLVNYVTMPEDLVGKAKELLNVIISKAPLAVEQILKLVNIACYAPAEGLAAEVTAFGQLFGTADAKEGIAAFLEKRAAQFTGV